MPADNQKTAVTFQESNTAAALEAGARMVEAAGRIVEIRGLPCVVLPSGMGLEMCTDAIEEADRRAAVPRELEGTAIHSELDSFIAHALRFKDLQSAVFADVDKVKLTAVYDYHIRHGEPRWGRHRSVYACPLSEEWKAWTGKHEKTMTQDEFGTWIDDHLADIASMEGYPPAAAVLEMARNLVVRSAGSFQRTINPTTGEGTLICKDEHDTQSSTKIHRAFMLGIPVFVGGRLYPVEARIRFRLENGRALFAYSLNRADTVLRQAFGEVRTAVIENTGLQLFAGSPE